MNDSKMVAALEIGTSKMQVFVGEIVDSESLSIIGMGQKPSAGVKKGDIVDLKKASQLAQEAILDAEKNTSIKTKSIYVGISGSQIKGMRTMGYANVRSANNIVTQEDVDRACEDAKSKTLPENRAFIHFICCGYYIDGVYCQDPVGKRARRIDAEFWLVHDDCDAIANTVHIVRSFGMEVDDIVLSAIASARMVTSMQQRKEGVLVIDIGCGTTDYAMYKNSRIVIAGTIPVGGDHITNDLAHGLRLYNKNAELLKCKIGKAVISEDEKSEFIWTKGDQQIGDRKISLNSMNIIIRTRLEELFLILRDELGEVFDSTIQSVVITGGTSRLTGITELAEGVLGVKCTTGKFNSWVKHSLCHPEFATSLGLLDYALENEIRNASDSGEGLFSKIKGLWRNL